MEDNNDFEVKRNQEFKELPKKPEDLTFRERYKILDNFLFDKVLRLGDLHGKQVKVLDFAGGIVESGSPTAHDLYETVKEKGGTSEVTVIDRNADQVREPLYSDIKYGNELANVDEGEEYDIVRALHIVDHMNREDYTDARGDIVKRVRDGGVFISLQQMSYTTRDSYGSVDRDLPNVIKIMQRRGGEMVLLAFFPDTLIPTRRYLMSTTDAEFKSKYREFSSKLKKGKVSIDINLDRRGYKQTVGMMRRAASGLETVEHYNDVMRYSPSVFSDNQGRGLPIFEQMAEARKHAPELFFRDLSSK